MKRKVDKDSPKYKMHMALGLMFLTVFIDLIGFGIVIPVLPLYAKQFGADGLTVGLLLMSYSLMQFFFAPFWGRLSDKVGRRPVLLISLSASALGYLIWGFSGSMAMLFASRIVAGFGNANMAVAQAYVSDVTPEDYRAQGMGMIGAAFGLGFVLGPAIGGIASVMGLHPNMLGFIAAAFSLIDLIFTAAKLPEPEVRSGKAHNIFALDADFYVSNILARRELLAPLAIAFIATFAFANMETTLVLLTAQYFGYSIQQNSWMFTYVGLLMVFVQGYLIRKLAKKYPDKPMINIGALLVAGGLLLIPATHTQPVLYLALALLAFGSGITTPSNQSLISKLAPKEHTGGVMGVAQSLSTLGRILGPLAGGFLWDRLGPASPYALGACAMFVAFLLSLALPVLAPAPKPAPAAVPVAAGPDA